MPLTLAKIFSNFSSMFSLAEDSKLPPEPFCTSPFNTISPPEPFCPVEDNTELSPEPPCTSTDFPPFPDCPLFFFLSP